MIETRRFAGWLWLLSGAPVGLAIMLMPPAARIWAFALFILLDTGHALSPIALAWTHGGFRRQVIYARPNKFITYPMLLFLGAIVIGVITQAGLTSYRNSIISIPTLDDWSNPFLLMAWLYSVWNPIISVCRITVCCDWSVPAAIGELMRQFASGPQDSLPPFFHT